LLAQEVASAGGNIYLYVFTMTGRGLFASLGAFHSEESMYLSKHYWTDWEKDPQDAYLSDGIIQYWTQFAAHGNPNVRNLPPWHPYQETDPKALELGRHFGLIRVPRANAMKVFEKLLQSKMNPR
jgi:para-nitrobenzyl esterase